MYVLRDSDSYIYPADRCRFQSTYNSTSGQYEISNAAFYNGAAATPVALGPSGVELGYIGKSGRFVAITD